MSAAATAALITIALLLAAGLILLVSWRNPDASQAIYRSGLGGESVSFGSCLVLPGVQNATLVDLTLTPLEFVFEGPNNPLLDADGQLFDLKLTVLLRPEATAPGIRNAMTHFGTTPLVDSRCLAKELREDFANAIRASVEAYRWDALSRQNEDFFRELTLKLQIFTPGFVIEDIAVGHKDKFPPEISARQGVEHFSHRSQNLT